jgi:hypothetical protein
LVQKLSIGIEGPIFKGLIPLILIKIHFMIRIKVSTSN